MNAHAGLRPFLPTHRLTRGILLAPIVEDVMLDADCVGDGPAYTRADWTNFEKARFERIHGAWHLDGIRCAGLGVERLTDQTAPDTAGVIALPQTPEWQEYTEYPHTAHVRTDGSVAIWSLSGPRAYRHLAHFCRAWKVLLSLGVTPSRHPDTYPGPVPEELIVRHTGEVTALFPPGHADRSFLSLLDACRSLRLRTDALYQALIRAYPDPMAFRLPPHSPLLDVAHSLWTLRQLQANPPAAPSFLSIPPYELLPLRGRLDGAKVTRLADSMRARGWQGPPILAERLPYDACVAWTGRHRILAARAARLPTVPVVLVDLALWSRAHGAPCPHGAVYDTRDEPHRAMLLALAGDMTAASLVAREISGCTEEKT